MTEIRNNNYWRKRFETQDAVARVIEAGDDPAEVLAEYYKTYPDAEATENRTAEVG